MKELNDIKTTKAGTIIAVAGAAIFGIGFVLAGFNFGKLQTVDKYKKRTVDVSGSVKAVEIREDDTNINITQSEDKDIHVICYENKDEDYDISDKDTLKIKKKRNRKFYFGVNVKTQNTSLEVQIPDSYDGEIKIDTDSSNISVDEIAARSCEIKVDDGNVKMNSCEIHNDIKIKSGSGNLKLSDSTFGEESDIDADDGNIRLENCTLSEESKINVKTGNVTLDSLECFDDLTIKTTDGNVKGTIDGDKSDFNIKSDTKDGNNNLKDKENGKDKTLSVKTICGNIDIEFD
ncbi:MAG: DUF4097 family beta strand repeat-containing protein [Oscillospiraceae bacterium]|nr:DUF4097 family beta strand repeat-containing protein [Oscillospiraceae bacterium]